MKQTFRVVAVDDEPLALDLLCDLLERDSEIELAGRCGDGHGALEMIQRCRPDIAFLDIEMPERGGLEVARALPKESMPTLIFVTAFSRHAARAFEVEALDYVVKPYSDERLFAVLERAKRRVRERRLGDLASQMATLNQEIQGVPSPSQGSETDDAYLRRVSVTHEGRSLILDAQEIQWIESCDYYARLHTRSGSHLVRTSLAAFEEQLDPRRFTRIHRRAIVNLDEVREVHQLLKGSRQVVLKDGTTLAISRSRARRVEALLVPRPGR